MKKTIKILIIAMLMIIYAYVCNITLLPSSIIIFEGEEVNLKTIAGINIKRAEYTNDGVIQASTNADGTRKQCVRNSRDF